MKEKRQFRDNIGMSLIFNRRNGMTTKNLQMSETYLIGVLLAVVGGFLDAYTYTLRGHVFANAQTGNMVLLAIKLSERDLKGAGFYLIPILAFVLGILTSEYIRKKGDKYPMLHWRQIVILIEFFIILSVSFIPKGSMNGIVNVLVAFICSIQVQSFRKVNGHLYATTMCTGNLRSAAEGVYRFIDLKDKTALSKSFVYLGIILAFIVGAFIGAVASNIYGVISALFCAILLLIVFFLMFRS